MNQSSKKAIDRLKEQSAKTRQLGLLELMYHRWLTKFDSGLFFQTAILRSNCLFAVKDVIESLNILVNFQPFLRTKVVERVNEQNSNDRKYFFEPTEVNVPDLVRVKTRCSGDNLSVIIGEEEQWMSNQTEKFGDGPLWKVILAMPNTEAESSSEDNIYTYEIVFIIHHVIVDAVSSYDLVYRQFLPILNQIINNRPVDDKFLHPLGLENSFEDEFLNIPNSGEMQPSWYTKFAMGIMRSITKLLIRDLYKPPCKLEGSPFDHKGADPITKVLEKDLMQKISEQRRVHSAKMHSILLTAFSCALAKLMHENGDPLPEMIKSEWTIDSRKLKKKFKSPQPLGMLIADNGVTEMEMPDHFLVSREEFWRNVVGMSGQIETQQAERQEEGKIASSWNPESASYWVSKMGTESDLGHLACEIGIKHHIIFSNLGQCSPGPELAVTSPNFVDADEMYFGVCGAGFQWMPMAFYASATYHKHNVYLVVCVNRKWITKEWGRRLVDEVESILKMACAEI